MNSCLISFGVLETEEFTYYGDLVGIKSAYAASPVGAYKLLNEYYNDVFFGLQPYYSGQPQRRVEMFSDSLMITGDDPEAFIDSMACVYGNLLGKGILLRGGMVSGPLTMDMRITVDNFRKNLPDSDVMARAATLEGMVKGARFLVESKLAQQLMRGRDGWLSTQGYVTNPSAGDQSLIHYRSLTPLSSGAAWEVLYPVKAEIETVQMDQWRSMLKSLELYSSQEVKSHFQETQGVLDRSSERLAHHRGA